MQLSMPRPLPLSMSRRRHRWSVLTLVNALVLSIASAAFGTVLVLGTAAPAVAAGTPNIAIAVTGTNTALIQAPATPLTYSATVTNPAPNANGYNLGYKVTLPAGVTFSSSSVGAPSATAPGPGGTTILYFDNVTDVLTNSSASISVNVLASSSTYPVNATVSVRIDGYINSDPRVDPTFSGTTVDNTTYTGTANGSALTTISAIKLTKSEPSTEGELVRGVHDHNTVYTLKVATNGSNPNSAVVVNDYLPAGLEFLGCGTWDNTTNSPTTGTNLEYPGAPQLDASTADLTMATLPLAAGTTSGCLTPDLVETLVVDPDGSGPAASGVYTHVQWTIGTMPTSSVLNLTYAAGIPMRANTTTWSGATPATACTASGCDQAANLDNNNGAETTDELSLTNVATAAGTYSGGVAPTTSKNVSDTGTKTVTAEDLAMQKSVNPTIVARGALSTWTLALETGEYRSIGGDLVITDTLPNGLCPLGAANYTHAPTAQDAECDPVAGRNPTISVNGGAAVPLDYNGAPVENADGTWTLSFAVPAGMAANSTMAITYPTRTREFYQSGYADSAPVLASDAWTNTAAATSTSTGTIIGTNVSGAPSPAPDESSAEQTSSTPALAKLVAVPLPNGQLDCHTATYVEADTAETATQFYRPGDRVCYRIRLTLNGGSAVGSELYFRNVTVTDFLSPGFVFDRFWGINAATGQTTSDEILAMTADATANPMVWKLGTPNAGGERYVDANSQKVFEVEFSALVPPASSIPAGGTLNVANLAKGTTVSTSGAATSLRNAALATVVRPSLTLAKSRVPSTAIVAPGSTIAYSLAVKNNAPLPDAQGFAGASTIQVRDLLPFELRCATVSAISNGGVCTDPSPDTPGSRSRIDWTLSGPLLAQQLQTVTYSVTLPNDLAPSEDLTNDAGIRSYAGEVNTGGAPTVYIPANNIDPTLVPNIPESARGTQTLALPPSTVVKLQQSELSESGNSRNATPATTLDQATIGEYVDYTIQATLPAGTTTYGGTFRDTVPAGLTLLTTGPNAVVPEARLNGAPLPADWSFNASTLTVTLADPYLVDSTADVIEVRFRAVVTDTAANAAGQNKVNTAAFTYKTKAAQMGVQPSQVVTQTGSATLRIVEPTLTMTKTDDDADKIVNPGQNVTYTLVASNSGSAAHEVVLTDCVPVHLTVVTPVTPPATPVGVVVTTDTAASGCVGTLITWTYPAGYTLDQGASTTVRYAATIDAPTTAGQTLVNTAKTFASSYAGTTNPDERTTYVAVATDTLRTSPPTLTKSVFPANLTVGSEATYTVQVQVPGGLAVPDATVRDVVPAGIDVESLTGVTCTNAPTGFTCPAVGAVSMLPAGGPSPTTGGAMLLFLDDLPANPAGSPWTITLTYVASVEDLPSVKSGSVLANIADLRWNATSRYDAGTLPNPANASAFDLDSPDATATVTIHEPKLATDKDVTYTAPTNSPCNQNHAATTGATDTDACGIAPDANPTTMTYTISVMNTGDWPAYEVAIDDSADLPAPSQIASLSITNAGGTTVVDADITDGDGLSFLYPGPLAAGATITITYVVELTPSAVNHHGDQVVNTVTVPSFRGIPEAERTARPDRAYRAYTGPSDTATVTLNYPSPTIVKTAVSDATDARVGQPFTYALTVGNISPNAPLYGADVVDVLPTGWTYVPGSASVVSSTGTTPASITLGNPVVAGQTLTWTDIAKLAPLGTFTIHYQAVPDASLATPATTGSFAHVNTATVTGEDGTGAAGNADGPYTATTTATAYIRRIDLELTKAIVTAGPVYAYGQTVQYSVVVTNKGPDAATGVTVLEKLPTALLYRSTVSATAGTYDAATGIWTIGGLASGGTQTLILSVQIDAAGPIANDAQVQTAGQYDIDSQPGNLAGNPAQDDEARVTITPIATSLGDRVWYDLDKDGVQDAGEPGLATITVTLQDPGADGVLGTADDGPTLTTTTDATGAYVFTGLAVNRPYKVSVLPATLPGGMAPTYDLDGLGTAHVATVTIPLAQAATGRSDVDFGYSGVGSIGDLVWLDQNNSGTAAADSGEPGLPGIPVTVTWAGVDGVLGTGDDIVYATTTDASGHYLVTGLPYGPYSVVVDTASPAFPAGLTSTYDPDATAPTNTSRTTLSGATPNVLTQDFSFAGTASIGDRLWLDANGDGVQDPGEKGIPGVTVTVTYLGPDGVLGGGDDLVLTTTTDASGGYLVDHLPVGAYTVAVTTTTLPGGLAETYDLDGIATANTTAVSLAANENRTDVDFGYKASGSIGDRIWLDTLANGDGTYDAGNDVPIPGVAVTVTYLGQDGVPGGGDDIIYTTTTDATGTYLVTGLPFGAYTVTVTPPASLNPTYDADGAGTPNTSAVTLTPGAPVNLAQDFSYAGNGSIGDLVWLDTDSSGTATPQVGEPGIPGVPVTVTWAGDDGVLGTADDVVIHTVTDATGAYLVQHLPYGPYSVVVDTTSPAFPAGVAQTYDADGLGSASSSLATLSAGTPNVLTQDFSYAGTASLGDRIWLDQNGDGMQDPGELGIPGVTVTVTYLGRDGVLGGGDDIVFTTTTDSTGAYLVAGLPVGDYTVTVDPATLPGGVAASYDLDGKASANTTAVTLGSGQNRRDADFGYSAQGSIGDQVWLDTANDGDGTFDAATDRPLAGVAITVTYLGLDGAPGGGDDMVFTTTTAADGTYLVTGLPLGAYTVSATPPVALTATYDADSTATPNTSSVSLTESAPANLTQDFSYAGTASLGDLIWHDRNADGVVDPGEEGIGGVVVTATWAGPDGVLGTADDIAWPSVTTAPDGSYTIPNLPAGSYSVVIDPASVPTGYVSTYDLDGSDLKATTTTLTVGQVRTDVDFGLREVVDLMVVKSHPAGGIDPGGSVTFRITVTNLGPGVARNVEATDTVPAGLVIDTISATGWTCTTSGQTISCVLDTSLASGAAAFLDVTTTATLAAAPGVLNTVTVTTDTPDVNPANDTSIDPVVVQAADLSITKKLVGGTLTWDKVAEYVLTVTNKGPSAVPAGKVVVSDPLPVQLTAISATSADFTCTISGQNIVCTNTTDYASGTTSTISIKVKVAKVSSPVSVVNTATVTGGFVDPTPEDEVDSATVTLGPLSSTGSDVSLGLVLATGSLLAAGGVLLLVGRRRRTLTA